MNVKSEEALATVKALNDDKDTLQAKINELEENINKLAALVKKQADGKFIYAGWRHLQIKMMNFVQFTIKNFLTINFKNMPEI